MTVLARELNPAAIFVDPGDLPDCLHTFEAELVSETGRTSLERAYQALENNSIDGLIVDSYDVSLRPSEHFVAAIDDFGAKCGFATATISPGFQRPGVGDGDIPNFVAGPSYALIDPEFVPSARKSRSGEPQIVIFFGGRDTKNVTELALEGIYRHAPHTKITLILGKYAKHVERIRQLSKKHDATLIIGASTIEMHTAYREADLAVGAGGVSLLERLRVGVPNILVLLADNQREQISQVTQLGAAVIAGNFGDSDLAARIGRCCAELWSKPERMTRLSERGQELVDGAGARRTGDFLNRAFLQWKEKRR